MREAYISLASKENSYFYLRWNFYDCLFSHDIIFLHVTYQRKKKNLFECLLIFLLNSDSFTWSSSYISLFYFLFGNIFSLPISVFRVVKYQLFTV